MDLVRFAELLNSQGELRDLWVKQKIRERAERSPVLGNVKRQN